MTGRGPTCKRCSGTNGLRFVGVYRKHSKVAHFWLCHPCCTEFDRFLAGASIPGLRGALLARRGFEIERGTDAGKENPATPEAE